MTPASASRSASRQFAATNEAVKTKRPVVVARRDDPRLTAEDHALYEREGFKSELCVPLVIEDRVVGLLALYDERERTYAQYLDFILTVGQMIGGAFENLSLLERLNVTNAELETLARSGMEFGSTLDLDQVLASVATRLREVSGAACCDIYAIDGDLERGLVSVDDDGADPDFPGTTYRLADTRDLARGRRHR